MSVGGYLCVTSFRSSKVKEILMIFNSIKARSLPRFWFYSFHYMDYQRYAFELLTNV
jgi:hypothetical protein